MKRTTIISVRTIPIAAALACAAIACADENWSRFRGPNGCGFAQGVSFPAAWSADDYRWSVKLPGKGHSSPVAWDDRLFLTTADPESGELTLLALNADSGETAWSKSIDASPHHLHAANSYASSSPAADERSVYITWGNGRQLLAAALSHDGEKIWRRELGPLNYQHGFGGSPVVVDGLLIIANDNAGDSFIAALVTSTGEPRWRKSRAGGTESYATPAEWRDGEGATQIIVHSTEEGIAALSPQDGRVLWQLKDVFPVRCVGSPLVAGGLVFGGSGEGGAGKSFAAVRPPAAAGGAATVAYQLTKSLPQVPTPVATDDLLFVWSDGGVASCYDLQTGKPFWTERLGGKHFSSPVIAGETLYAVAADGQVVAVAASPEFKLLGRSELGEASSATPMIHRDRMYLRGESSLFCLEGQRITRDR
jgi:outer membrane protein assembly factor BamB